MRLRFSSKYQIFVIIFMYGLCHYHTAYMKLCVNTPCRAQAMLVRYFNRVISRITQKTVIYKIQGNSTAGERFIIDLTQFTMYI